jgi:hypothetical protein
MDRPVVKGTMVLRGLEPGGGEFTAQCGADDRWLWSDLPAGWYRILYAAEAHGSPFDLMKVQVRPGDAREYPARVSFTTLSGTVLDRESKAPLAGARVYLSKWRSGERVPESAAILTDGAGIFESKRLPAGMYSIVVRAPGYGLGIFKQGTQLREDSATEILLEKARGLEIEFTGPSTGEELWVEVTTRILGTNRIPLLKTPKGTCLLDLAPGTYAVRFTGDGFPQTSLELRTAAFESRTSFRVEPGKKTELPR